MPAFERVYSLYLDKDAPGGLSCLLAGTSGAVRTQAVQWMQADAFTIRLYFRERAGLSATTSVELGSGDEIVLAGKASLAATDLLFSVTSWTKVTSGSEVYYQGTLDLNTTELETAMTSTSVTALVDVEVQNADNTRRLSYRFSATVAKQVYDGESDPTPGTPTYPSPSALMVKNPEGGSYRFKDGNLQFWNPTTEKYHTLFPFGPEGSVTSEWGAGET